MLREAHRVVGRRVERRGVAQIERRGQPHARGRRPDARWPVPGAEEEALERAPPDEGEVVRGGGPEAAPGLLDGAGGDSGRDADPLAQQPGHAANREPRVLAGELSRRAQYDAAVGAGHEVGVVHGQHHAPQTQRSGVHGEHLPALGGDGRSRGGAGHAAAADARADEDGGRLVDSGVGTDPGDSRAVAQDFLHCAAGDDLHSLPPAGDLERRPQLSDFEVTSRDVQRSQQISRKTRFFAPQHIRRHPLRIAPLARAGFFLYGFRLLLIQGDEQNAAEAVFDVRSAFLSNGFRKMSPFFIGGSPEPEARQTGDICGAARPMGGDYPCGSPGGARSGPAFFDDGDAPASFTEFPRCQEAHDAATDDNNVAHEMPFCFICIGWRCRLVYNMEAQPPRKQEKGKSADKKTTARESRRFGFSLNEGYSSESPPFVTLAA